MSESLPPSTRESSSRSHRRRRRKRRSKTPVITPGRIVAVIVLLLGLGGMVLADRWFTAESLSRTSTPSDQTPTTILRPTAIPLRIELPTSSIPKVSAPPTATPVPAAPPAAPTAAPLPTNPPALPPSTPLPPTTGPAAGPRTGSRPADKHSDLAASVPADALLLFQANPFAQGVLDQSARLADMIRMLLPFGQIVPPDIKAFIDLLAPLPTLSQRQHALAVLSAVVDRLEGNVVRLARLDMALIIRTNGDNREVLQRLQAIISSYLKPEDVAIQVHERPQQPQYNSQRLIHAKLPPWAYLEWGPMDDCYVIALGDGVFDRVLAVRQGRAESMADQVWYQRSQTLLKGPTSFLSLFVDVERLNKQLDAVLAGIPGKIVHALQLETTRQVRWAMGMEGRFIRSLLWLSDGNPANERVIVLSDPTLPPPEVAQAIPPQATICSVSKFDMPLQLTKIGQAWMSAMTPYMQGELRDVWQRLGDRVGGDMYQALIARTGPHLVIHNYPPHELGWSLMFTLLLQYDGAPTVKPGVDAVMEQLQRELNIMAEKSKCTFNLRLVRDPDGIWSLPLILFTPALGVSDHWVVISWSPQAVRANMIFLSKQAGANPDPTPGR